MDELGTCQSQIWPRFPLNTMGIGIKMWTYSGHAMRHRGSQASVRIAFGLHNLIEK